MKMRLHTFDLKLKEIFRISRRSFDSQKTLIVELEEDGISGYGEATFNPYYNNTDIETMCRCLEKNRSKIESQSIVQVQDFWEDMKTNFTDFPFALCALDVAAHDLMARRTGKKLYEFLGLNLNKIPLSSYTISINSIPKVLEKVKLINWSIYKIKLGTKDDLSILKALREQTDAKLRVDINCAWNVKDAIEYSKAFKDLNVEFIEQPLPVEDIKGQALLFKESALPIIADESCKSEKDIEYCAENFHGINVKIMKTGGITPAIRMLKKAKKLGLCTMLGCMTESTVGISAIAHLLPLLDYADMDGAIFLKNDIASGVYFEKGIAHFPDELGTGVKLF